MTDPTSSFSWRRVAGLFRPHRATVALTLGLVLVTSVLGVVNPLLIQQVFDRALFPSDRAGPDVGLLVTLTTVMLLVGLSSGALGVWQTAIANRLGQRAGPAVRTPAAPVPVVLRVGAHRRPAVAHLQRRRRGADRGDDDAVVDPVQLRHLRQRTRGDDRALLAVDGARGRHGAAVRAGDPLGRATTGGADRGGAGGDGGDERRHAGDVVGLGHHPRPTVRPAALGDPPVQTCEPHAGRRGHPAAGHRPGVLHGDHDVPRVVTCDGVPGGGAAARRGRRHHLRGHRRRLHHPADAVVLPRGADAGDVRGAAVLTGHVPPHLSYLDVESDVVEAADPRHLDPSEATGRLRFDDVHFAYRGHGLEDAPALRGVSFTAEPGQLVAFVGASGAGKTTVLNLVARLYDPTRGRITVDGIDLRELSFSSLAGLVGFVTQESYLFGDTLRANIAYGHPDATDEEVEKAARAAAIHDRIMELPDGYATVTGERGFRLSGGERQRVAIARVILHAPKILILDEATSALDTASERRIQAALNELISGRTTLAVAHRLSTVLAADVIHVVERGCIVESGTHGQLLRRAGAYERLYTEQFGSGTIEAHCADGLVMSDGSWRLYGDT